MAQENPPSKDVCLLALDNKIDNLVCYFFSVLQIGIVNVVPLDVLAVSQLVLNVVHQIQEEIMQVQQIIEK